MMGSLPLDQPLELPLPRRVETSSEVSACSTAMTSPACGVVSEDWSKAESKTQGLHLPDFMLDGGSRLGGARAGGSPTKLFVGGVSAHTTTEALRSHFAKYGRIIDVVVMQKNGRPRGFGFVTFDHALPAELALAEPQWVDGRLVDVKRAVPGERIQERASNKIFVGGLPQDVSTEELRNYFSSYGSVADAVVMVDRRTNRSRGFGFVRFGNGMQGYAASEAVLMDFASHRLAGKWVEVKRATPASQLQEGLNCDGLDGDEFGMMSEDLSASMVLPDTPSTLHGVVGVGGWDSSPGTDSTPMSSSGRSNPNGHGNRGRRTRRRKQRASGSSGGEVSAAGWGESYCVGDSFCDGSVNEDLSDDGLMNHARFMPGFDGTAVAMSDSSGVAFVSVGDGSCESCLVGPRALGAVNDATPGGSRRSGHGVIGSVAVGSTAKFPAVPVLSENDPSLANAANRGHLESPMKVAACRRDDCFTREDFLSLEVGVRPWLSAW